MYDMGDKDQLIFIVDNSEIREGDMWFNVNNNEYGISRFKNGIPPEWGATFKIRASNNLTDESEYNISDGDILYIAQYYNTHNKLPKGEIRKYKGPDWKVDGIMSNTHDEIIINWTDVTVDSDILYSNVQVINFLKKFNEMCGFPVDESTIEESFNNVLNDIIAKFMGYVPTEKETGEPTYTHEHMEKGTIIWLSQFDYHLNWVSIIPVCQKIDRLAEDGIIPWSDDYSLLCDELDESVTKRYDINDVYPIVIKIIMWYNEKF